MLKFPPQLTVHKDSVFSVLYVVAGLLMTATAGSHCVDVAVMTAQNPANLRRLSVTLITLMGLRHHIHANSGGKRKLKKLYFTDSFNHLLETGSEFYRNYHRKTKPHDLKVWRWLPSSPEMQTAVLEHLISPRCIIIRRRIYYILICGVNSQLILTLRIGNGSCSLNTYTTFNRLQWLLHFGSKAQRQGDVILLLLAGKTQRRRIRPATNEPPSLTLGFSVLCVILLWMFLPYIAVFAGICLGWKVSNRVLQAKK